MSDPVTNVAIEDVLSSIRRLVSEDARVRPHGLRAEPAVPEASTGKLVLTPALRVSAPAADETSAEAVADESAQAPELQQHDDVAESDLNGSAAADDAGFPDGAETADPYPPAADTEAQDASDLSAIAWEDHLDETDDAAPLRLSDALIADIPEAVTDADTETDTAEADAGSDAGLDTILAAAAAAAQAASSEEAAPHDAWAMASTASDTASEVAPEAGDTMTEGSDDAADPSDFIFASSRDPIGYDDAEMTATAAAYDAGDSEETGSSIFRDDETILDEESLRELVAEIVRQELQGALGERITRNVRKLVRREIHRALTSHELE